MPDSRHSNRWAIQAVWLFESWQHTMGQFSAEEVGRALRVGSGPRHVLGLHRRTCQRVAVASVTLSLAEYHNRFVVTGGPGFGKTTLLNELCGRGYSVCHEAARAEIDEQARRGSPLPPWERRPEFDRLIIPRMEADYPRDNCGRPCFYDRGFPDLMGWRSSGARVCGM